MINKSLFAIIAGVIAVSLFSLPTIVTAQQQQQDENFGLNNQQSVINSNTNTTGGKSYLFGCKDGIVIFENNASLKMGCVVAPFNFKAFNGTDAKTYQNIPTYQVHINVQKICNDLHLDKKVCNKLPKSVP